MYYNKRRSGRGGFSRGRSASGARRTGGFNKRRTQPQGLHPDIYVAKAQPQVEAPSIYAENSNFSDFPLEEVLQRNIASKGYVHPTLIQDQTIRYILQGKDLLGQASTGSGKTAAFLIPLVNKLIADRGRRTQRCLIVLPTRELAQQILEEFNSLALNTGLHATLIIGGASMFAQQKSLARKPHVVIGTPGRLKDQFERKVLNLHSFNNVVLDEVDRMLDMGFIHDIKFLISQLKEERQSLFFSATMSKDATAVAHSLLKEPVTVQTAQTTTAKNVDQDVVRVSGSQTKVDVLHDLLIKADFEKVLVFSRTKYGADRLSRELSKRGFNVDSIHGDKPQGKRQRVINNFRDNRIKILIATDVVARGLDVPNITHVINYDEPATYEDYIHRIGRTGRIGKPGKALTFLV